MKYLNLLLIFLSLATVSHAQYKPSLKEVVTEFFTRYHHDSNETYIKFQKRKDGWHVVKDRYDDFGKYFDDQLFWSDKDKRYLEVTFNRAPDDTASISERIANYMKVIDWGYEEPQFAKHRYYGYPGWDWDILSEPIDTAQMTDTEWESLARANSNYASGFIVEQFGDVFLNNDADRQPLKPRETLSKSRADKFIFYETKAIEAYKMILKHNPDYETRVGKVQIKCANEYMFMYLDLLMTGDSVDARKFAAKANYPDSLLNHHKLSLAALPPNSILITEGDNDTYALLYLQEVNNYRKDVVVLNYSLLGLRQFLLFADKKYRKALFTTVDTNYLKSNFDYFVFMSYGGTNPKVSVKEFIENLTKSRNPYDTSVIPYKGQALRKYYTKQVFLSKKTGNVVATSRPIILGDYLLLNDFIVLDILNTSIKKRKVYFTFPASLYTPLLRYQEPVYQVEAF